MTFTNEKGDMVKCWI